MENQEQPNEQKKEPKVECFMELSKDKQWFIHKTIITNIKHINYLDKVRSGKKEDK